MIPFLKYLFSKRSEIQDLDYRDALLAQANVRIYRKRTHKTRRLVPLKHLKFIHSLERENAKNVLAARKAALEANREAVLDGNQISLEVLYRIIPSISPIKVVEANRINYFLFEGNGRVAALKEVFGDREDILVEVEEYHFRNKKDIIRKLNRLRKLNGLI